MHAYIHTRHHVTPLLKILATGLTSVMKNKRWVNWAQLWSPLTIVCIVQSFYCLTLNKLQYKCSQLLLVQKNVLYNILKVSRNLMGGNWPQPNAFFRSICIHNWCMHAWILAYKTRFRGKEHCVSCMYTSYCHSQCDSYTWSFSGVHLELVASQSVSCLWQLQRVRLH